MFLITFVLLKKTTSMYPTFFVLHNFLRWLVLLSLLYSVYRAFTGYKHNLPFGKRDNAIRHWTATIAHVQLVIGFVLYIQSPIVTYFWKHKSEAVHQPEVVFFSLLHIALMLLAVVLITIGSAMAKRKTGDRARYKTMLIWFGLGLAIIFLAIPWPFSPLASRPYIRHF